MSVRRRHTFFFRFDDPDAVDKFTYNTDPKSITTTHFTSPREDRIIVPLSVALSPSNDSKTALVWNFHVIF